MPRKTKKLKHRKTTVSSLKMKVWKLFSKYIKMRDAKWRHGAWECQCVTCGRWMDFDSQDCQAGHFLDGRTKGILFEPRCVHVQCKRCNIFLDGNKDAYWPWMLENYGQPVIDELIKLKHRDQGSWKVSELRDLMDYWENQVAARLTEMSLTEGRIR